MLNTRVLPASSPEVVALIASAFIVLAATLHPALALLLACALPVSGLAVLAPDGFWITAFLASLFLSESIAIGPVRNARLCDLVAAVLISRWLVRIAFRPASTAHPHTSAVPPLLLALLAALLSGLGAQSRTLALIGALQMLEYLLLYLALTDLLIRRYTLVPRLARIFVGLVGIEVLIGIRQFAFGIVRSGQATHFRAEGSLGQNLAVYLGIAIAILFCGGLATKCRSRLLYFAGCMGLLVAATLTKARGAVVWLVLAMAVPLCYHNRRLALKSILVLLIVSVALFAVVSTGMIEALGTTTPLGRMLSLVYFFQGEQTAYGNWTVLMRLELWWEALKMYWDHPLFGIGAKNYFLHLVDYATPFVWRMRWALSQGGESILSAHNQYCLTLAETGTVGIVALLWLLWKSVRETAILWKLSITVQQKQTALTLAGVIAYIWLCGISADFLYSQTGSLFVAFLALTSASITVISSRAPAKHS
jgi:O-antigen ligase